jgi:hypothetical protein
MFNEGQTTGPSSCAVSVVLQGPVVPDITARSCENLRKSFPNAEIILSTWRHIGVKGLAVDAVVRSEDPGPYEPLRTSGNVNRQITSTRNGLACASRPIAVKMRTDCELDSAACLSWFHRAATAPRPLLHRILRARIVIPRHFTRNPAKVPFLHHPSDIFQIGLTEDLIFYWSSRHARQAGLVSEQFLWLSCIQRANENSLTGVRTDVLWPSTENIAISEHFLASNFLMADTAALGLHLPEATANNQSPFCGVDTCYTPMEWNELTSKKAVDAQATTAPPPDTAHVAKRPEELTQARSTNDER